MANGTTAGLSTNDYSSVEKSKLAAYPDDPSSLPGGAVDSVFGRTGDVVAADGDYSIDQLSDVDVTGAENGQLLQYDNVNGKWVPGAPGAVVVNLGYTEAADKGTVTNDSGNDAVIPLADGVNAGLSLNNYSATDKNKLDGIDPGAEANVTPTISYNVMNGGADGTLTINPGGDTAIIDNATVAAAGLMTNSDKTKLDGIDPNAQVNVNPTIAYTAGTGSQGGTLELTPGGDTAVVSLVSGSENGLMLATDKTKLDGIPEDAEANIKPDWDADPAADDGILNKPDLSVYLTDAPSDGKQYARQDAAWTEVTGGGGGGGGAGDLQSVLEAGYAVTPSAALPSAKITFTDSGSHESCQFLMYNTNVKNTVKFNGNGIVQGISHTNIDRALYEPLGFGTPLGMDATPNSGLKYTNTGSNPVFIGQQTQTQIVDTVTIFADGNASFAGEITTQGGAGGPYLRIGSSIEVLLDPDNPANYTTTDHVRTFISAETEEEETEIWQSTSYTGPVINIVERVQNLLSRVDAMEANEISDDATDSALLHLVSRLDTRLSAIEERLNALEGNS